MKRFVRDKNQIILHTQAAVCATADEVLTSGVFRQVFALYLDRLQQQDSPLRAGLPISLAETKGPERLQRLLLDLCFSPLEKNLPALAPTPTMRKTLLAFVEGLYTFWRTFDRFLVLHSEPGPSGLDRRPYRSFNATTEALTHLIRSIYRDVCENISGDHPRVYRQVAAGCDVGLIAIPRETRLPDPYQALLGEIPFIRQAWIAPPLVIDPPTNTRTGVFQKIDRHPLQGVALSADEWLCYPAQVGQLVVFIYFHQCFMNLGCSLANLFELATDAQIQSQPHAIYLYGMPPGSLASFGDLPTVFYDDEKNSLLVGAVPGEDRFGYFGYLKKMILTLHNVAVMKSGRLPYHGAMVRILLKSGHTANVLIIGDTATGKSETLEALRLSGADRIREMSIVADDMGSLVLGGAGQLLGYGTEIGAFIRLDDLQQGYAFSQIDRAILMSPQKINARVVLPVTTLDEITAGYPVDFLLYANNYEKVDDDHPVLERLPDMEKALAVFREGAAMAKGTTSASGLMHTYFANCFGPPQYKKDHERLAHTVFQAAYAGNVWIGQMRTRLGIPGFETLGPREAADALLQQLETEGMQKRNHSREVPA